MPAVAVHVPGLGGDDVAPGYAGIVEDARKPVEERLLAAERLAGAGFRFVLFYDLWWNRGR